MTENSFTLIDAFNQYWTVCGNGNRRSLSCAGLTYFYLCSVWNTTGRSISFRRQNNLICAELSISKPTLEKHRNILKQAGLIDFFTKGSGDPNISYKIIPLVKKIPGEVKKENNLTSSFTSSFTSDPSYKQSKSKEKEFLLVIIAGEIKNFTSLEKIFTEDAGLQARYSELNLPPGNFNAALEKWMMQNHGKTYPDFETTRKHFFFWMPNFKIQNNSHYETKNHFNNRKKTDTGRKTDLDYAGGL